MKIITCLKYVPETLSLTEEGTINRSSEAGKINPADMYAIEESIRIKERYGAETIGLCMGVLEAAPALRQVIAMGMDRVVLMSDKRFAGSDTFSTSYILSRGIASFGKFDLVLCGKQSADGDTGQVAQALAGHMGLPCLINVVGIEFLSDSSVCCIVLTEKGYLETKVELPAVISVLKGINEPRLPSVSGILKAQAAKVCIISADDIEIETGKCGLGGSPTRVRAIRKCNFERKKAVDITDGYACVIDKKLRKIQGAEQICQRRKEEGFVRNLAANLLSKEQEEVWVLCEITDGKVSHVSRQVLSKAAEIIGKKHRLCAVILEPVQGNLLDCLADYGVSRLYYVSEKTGNGAFDEFYPNILCAVCKKYKPGIVLLGGTVWGRWIAPTVAAKLGTGLTADCFDLRIEENTGNLIQVRTAYGGNLTAEIVCPQMRPQMATVRTNTFPDLSGAPGKSTPIDIINIDAGMCTGSRIAVTGMRPGHSFAHNLADARIVLCGGRGMGGKQGFDMLLQLASLTGGAVGATRYAVDAGWIDYSFQIGQTGITVRPEIYISFGVSGATEHIVGMRNSDCVISVNRDDNAPIFGFSDYKIIGDCSDVLKVLLQYFTKRKER